MHKYAKKMQKKCKTKYAQLCIFKKMHNMHLYHDANICVVCLNMRKNMPLFAN